MLVACAIHRQWAGWLQWLGKNSTCPMCRLSLIPDGYVPSIERESVGGGVTIDPAHGDVVAPSTAELQADIQMAQVGAPSCWCTLATSTKPPPVTITSTLPAAINALHLLVLRKIVSALFLCRFSFQTLSNLQMERGAQEQEQAEEEEGHPRGQEPEEVSMSSFTETIQGSGSSQQGLRRESATDQPKRQQATATDAEQHEASLASADRPLAERPGQLGDTDVESQQHGTNECARDLKESAD